MEDQLCTNCRFHTRKDYGYSNYTVEGSTIGCLFGLNPDFDGDEPKDAAKNEFAKQCDCFRQGTGVYSDVDGEDHHESIRDWIKLYIKDQP